MTESAKRPPGHDRVSPSRATTRITLRDLAREAIAGLAQRPGRSALTVLGTVLGVGAFVAVLGLTTTAASQIGDSFSALTASTVVVSDLGDSNDLTHDFSFPADASSLVTRLNGVKDSGIYFNPTIRPAVVISTVPPLQGGANGVRGVSVTAIDLGIFRMTGVRIVSGRAWDEFAQERGESVAVLGADAARALNISRLDTQPVVFVNSNAYIVIGIVAEFQRLPELSASVLIPTKTAIDTYGIPEDARATMVVQTQLGAAQLVASQVATALRPDNPRLFSVKAPADPTTLRAAVTGQLNSLFLLLAAISLIIGAIGIANTTLVAVLERTGEIGLRRAMGARPRHVAGQFLAECAALGTLGGLMGATLGVTVTLVTAVVRQWTPVVEPWTVAVAPLIGTAIGTLAGIYPALRAARIEPALALRR